MAGRAESILSYEGNEIRSERFISIDRKFKKIMKLSEQKRSLPERYYSDSLINDIIEWKELRNQLMHALMRQSLTTEELEKVALSGKDYARTISNRANNYKRTVERRHKD